MMIRIIVWPVMSYIGFIRRDLVITRADRQIDGQLLEVAAIMFILGVALWAQAL